MPVKVFRGRPYGVKVAGFPLEWEVRRVQGRRVEAWVRIPEEERPYTYEDDPPASYREETDWKLFAAREGDQDERTAFLLKVQEALQTIPHLEVGGTAMAVLLQDEAFTPESYRDWVLRGEVFARERRQFLDARVPSSPTATMSMDWVENPFLHRGL